GVGRPASGLGHHRRAAVEADHAPGRCDERGHRAHVVAGAAADVERVVSGREAEHRDRARLVRPRPAQCARLVQVADEEARIARAIDRPEVTDRAVGEHHAPSRTGSTTWEARPASWKTVLTATWPRTSAPIGPPVLRLRS